MNRRSILGLISAAPFAGNAIGQSLPNNAGLRAGVSFGGETADAAYPMEKKPRMDHKSAVRTILGDPQAMAEIREDIQREFRVVSTIDPDLMVMKSFSDMAKITFQRQRNVERAIAEISESGEWNNPRHFMHAVATRINKLMWGK